MPSDRVDALSSTPPAEAPERRARSPILRSVLLGLSVAGSLLGPASGAALAGPATAMAQTVAPTADTLIDQMIANPTRASSAELGKVRASMRRIPVSALQLLARNGTHVVVMKPGQTPLDAGVVRPVDLHAYDNPTAMVASARSALQRTDHLYRDRIAALERRLDGLQRIEQDEPSDELQQARADLERLQGERDAIVRRAVQEATDGMLEPAMTEEAGQMGRLARVSPVSLRDLAEGKGARTDAERREYAQLVQRINGDRVAQAQRAYGVDEHQLAVEDRSMMAYDAQLLVPAFKYDRAAENGPSTRLTSYDVEAIETWRDEAARGQYFYRGSINTVLVRANALGPQEDGHDVVLHELGHAFEDAKATLQPQAFPAYVAQRDAAFARIPSTHNHPYRNDHAGSAPGEMAAQTFADTIDHREAGLRTADPAWTRAFDAWVAN